MALKDMNALIGAAGCHLPANAEHHARAQLEQALEFLHSKGWADASAEDILSRGPHMALEILRVKNQESLCAECRETGSLICPAGKNIPVICREERRGFPLYSVRYSPCPVARERASAVTVFERLVRNSCLTERQREQTFASFSRDGISRSVRRAFFMATAAAEDGSWLMLGGLRGAGKSHLAAAVALEFMRTKEQQAYFCLVSEMLDALRQSYDDGDHADLMKFLKDVPCLVLDDLGKERGTEAARDFLYQIIDARYRERRQVIVTTNARSKEELAGWGDGSFISPLLSRMDEMGDWVFITDAEDYRAKLGERRRAKKTA